LVPGGKEAEVPLQDYMKVISVDDHLFEHARVWLDRVPAKYHDVAPRRFNTGKAEYWLYEDQAQPAFIMLVAPAARPLDEWEARIGHGTGAIELSGWDCCRAEDLHPAAENSKARLEIMDVDGVWAEACFPTYPRFAGTKFLEAKDKELALLCVQAYNDFVLEEWCAAAPDRYISVGILPLWDPQLAAAELERVAAKGMHSITFPENPVPLGLPSFHTNHWNPVFAAAQETGLPLNMHFGSSSHRPITAPDAPMSVEISLNMTCAMFASADLCFSPVFHNFPNLKVALSEGAVGWIPYLFERMDWTWERQRDWDSIAKDVAPSALFKKNIWGCFISDQVGVRERHTIGVDRLMVESDYPHADTTYPYTRKWVAEALAEVPDDEAHQIAELNARELYRFPA
jgi:predicted TIM-barrel fold metal-dependent hydrolase